MASHDPPRNHGAPVIRTRLPADGVAALARGRTAVEQRRVSARAEPFVAAGEGQPDLSPSEVIGGRGRTEQSHVPIRRRPLARHREPAPLVAAPGAIEGRCAVRACRNADPAEAGAPQAENHDRPAARGPER